MRNDKATAPAVAFMGSDAIALPLLERLLGAGHGVNWRLAGIVSQPDRPKGRGKKLQPNPVAAFASERRLPVLQPEKPDETLLDWLNAEAVQLVFVMAYGHILRKKLLETPPLGCLNFHASLLPKYRGASPIESALASGERETGVSLMRIVRKMDAGAVADVERVATPEGMTAAALREALAAACVPLLERNLLSALQGELNFTEQDESRVSYCRKLTKEDGALDFHAAASIVAARINGLDPWPGTAATLDDTRLKLRGAATVQRSTSSPPGTILEVGADGVFVSCGNEVVRVTQLQKPGGKWMAAADIARGFPLEPGHIFQSEPMTTLAQREPFHKPLT